jgi:hypothetical protein
MASLAEEEVSLNKSHTTAVSLKTALMQGTKEHENLEEKQAGLLKFYNIYTILLELYRIVGNIQRSEVTPGGKGALLRQQAGPLAVQLQEFLDEKDLTIILNSDNSISIEYKQKSTKKNRDRIIIDMTKEYPNLKLLDTLLKILKPSHDEYIELTRALDKETKNFTNAISRKLVNKKEDEQRNKFTKEFNARIRNQLKARNAAAAAVTTPLPLPLPLRSTSSTGTQQTQQTQQTQAVTFPNNISAIEPVANDEAPPTPSARVNSPETGNRTPAVNAVPAPPPPAASKASSNSMEATEFGRVPKFGGRRSLKRKTQKAKRKAKKAKKSKQTAKRRS